MYGIRTKAFASKADVSVGTSDTVILTLTPAGLFSAMVVEVSSDSGSAASLNSFTIQRQDHARGAWYDYITTWTSPYPLGLSFVSATPATLAADATVHLHVDIGSAYGVRFVATVAATTADITIIGLQGDATLPGALAEVNISGFATQTTLAAAAADLNELTAAPVAKNWVMGGAVVAAGPAPAPLAASETFARKVIMTAVKAAGTANTGVVYVGDANLIDTTAACIQLAPGESFTLEGSPGTKFDLNLLKMDGANVGDGVRYIYQPI